jgi:hypothetical protein
MRMTAISTHNVSTYDALPFADLEQVYEQLAVTLDAVPEKKQTLFLAQLALALAHRIPDIDQVFEAINEAREGTCFDERKS